MAGRAKTPKKSDKPGTKCEQAGATSSMLRDDSDAAAPLQLAMEGLREQIQALRSDLKTELRSFKEDITTQMKREVTELREDIDQKFTTVSKDMREHNERIEANRARTEEMETWTTEANTVITELLKERRIMIEKLDDLESRSRRNNLRIYGIPEDTEQNGQTIDFIKQWLDTELSVGTDLQIQRAHRALTAKPKADKPPRFDEELGVIYMAARLAGGYAAVSRALNEIKKRDACFAPESLLDFGSGLGTVAWASHSYWPDSLKEMVCVDSSAAMNTLAERLLKGDDEREEPHFRHVYFRQFLPVSPKVQFDLVAAAFTLSELPKAADREDVLLTLWRKTNRYLVLVENGTKEGHQMLMEARDTLLNKQEKIIHDFRPASVFAPCPHEMMCPKLAKEPFFPCNFQQKYHTLSLPRQVSHLTEKFSYVILTRADPKVSSVDSGLNPGLNPGLDSGLNPGLDSGLDPGLDWGRLVAPVLPRTRHVHCRLCCSDGQLQHVVVTPRKHGRDVYRCARSSDWGDQIPLVQMTDVEDHSESEEE